ncbi:KTSC domain-containing protein [Maribacter aquivivus]
MIWNGFVKAESKGKYYNMVIRNKYFFPLNQ